MKAPEPSNHGRSAAADELHGWKEIANYLGRSVRAAQRWEREMGLPVRRLKTTVGQVIFARRAELDHWRATHELGPLSIQGSDQQQVRRAKAGKHTHWWMRKALWGVCLTSLVAGVLAVAGRTSRDPRSFRLIDRALVASKANGTEVWRHAFEGTLRPLVGEPVHPHLSEQVKVVDLDLDGEEEVLTLVGYDNRRAVLGDELFCFGRDGKVKWRFRPEHTLGFRSERFSAPWHITDLLVIPRETHQEIWLALAHHTWWPPAVLKLSPSGETETRFIHSGALYALGTWEVAGIIRLVASGINNEYASAAVALLSLDGEPASSPQTSGSKYECVDCPNGRPLAYFTFGRSELNRASDVPYNRANSFNIFNGALVVMTQEAPDVPSAAWLYRVNSAHQVDDATPSDSYWVAHRRYEQIGRIMHPAEDCPAKATEVRMFDGQSGWRNITTPSVNMPVPGSSEP